MHKALLVLTCGCVCMCVRPSVCVRARVACVRACVCVRACKRRAGISQCDPTRRHRAGGPHVRACSTSSSDKQGARQTDTSTCGRVRLNCTLHWCSLAAADVARARAETTTNETVALCHAFAHHTRCSVVAGMACSPRALGKVKRDEVLFSYNKTRHVLPHGSSEPLKDKVESAAGCSVEPAPRPVAGLRDDDSPSTVPAGRSPVRGGT